MNAGAIPLGLLSGLVLAAAARGAEEPARGSPLKHSAIESASTTIYHSPQTPGFTCWAGAWVMPDQSLMVTFTRATGPFKGRPRTDPKVLASFPGWPPDGNANYDMNGLDLRNVYLHSKDGGKTWKEVSADPFRSCMNHATGKGQVALADGTVVRAVWGQYLPFDDGPKTGYLQRSRDGAKTWGPPEPPLLDPRQFTTYPTRLRVLRDGRLIVTGGLTRLPAGTLPGNVTRPPIEPLLMASADGGKTWSKPIPVVPDEHRGNWSGEEYDVAELAGGDLLCVFRTVDPGRKTEKEVRWQGLLRKDGTTWRPRDIGPSALGHSGHPDLLATKEGVVLHVATDGIHGTTDGGKSWHPLEGSRASRYYPRSVQGADGRIAIFSHVGGDDAYGAVDQSIVMDTFRLSEK